MGTMMLAQCKKCNFSKQLFLGGGLKDCEMKTLSSVVPKKKYWQFKAALATMPPGGFAIDRKAGICKKCKTLCTAPIVRFRREDGSTARELTGVCPDCESEIDFFLVPELEDCRINCPDCGADLSFQTNGNWD